MSLHETTPSTSGSLTPADCGQPAVLIRCYSITHLKHSLTRGLNRLYTCKKIGKPKRSPRETLSAR
eukprot:694545-Prorocentrum_minimum.AAC.2